MAILLALLTWLWWLKQVQALVSEKFWLAGMASLFLASFFAIRPFGKIQGPPFPIALRLLAAVGYLWLTVLAGYPYGIGFALLTVGVLFDVWWLRRLGAVNVALAVSNWIIPAMTATIDSHWTLAPLTTLLARWAKVPTAFVDGQTVWISAQSFAAPLTLRMDLVPIWLMFVIAVALWFWQGVKGWQDWLRFVGTVAGTTFLISLLSSVVIMTTAVALNSSAPLISPSVRFLVGFSYAFAIEPLTKGFSPSLLNQATHKPFPSPFAFRPLFVTAAIVLFLTCLFMPDLGKRKQGRIAFDEYHSVWEPIDIRYDITDWREGTGYTFNRMAFFLGKTYRVKALRQPITPQALKDLDVLILKIPTLPYTKAEADAIKAWVKEGGGLWLIGDHTNVFGSATALNSVASAFGIVFLPDAIYPSFHSLTSSHWLEFTRPPFLWHPILAGSPHLTFYTSCSLHTPLLAHRVIVGAHMFSNLADYARQNFFGEFDRTAVNRFGDYAFCIAKTFGKGRIVALGESTFLSNFSLPEPGNWELTLHTVEWLNRRNAKGWKWLMVFISGLLLLLAVFPAPRHLSLIPYILPLAFAIALTATHWLSAYASRPPKTIPLGEQVFFLFTDEKERSLFIGRTTHDPSEQMFHELFVSPQRIGLLPRLVHPNELPNDAARAKAVAVLVTPMVRLTAGQVKRLANWVAKGGRFLWLIDPSGWERPPIQEETEIQVEFAIHPFFLRPSQPFTPKTKKQRQEIARRLLAHDPAYQHFSHRLGISVQIEGLRESERVRIGNAWLIRCWGIAPLHLAKGGRVIGRLNNGRPVIVAVTMGKGEVIVAPLALTFARDAFGASLRTLEEHQKKRHFLLFQLLKDVSTRSRSL